MSVAAVRTALTALIDTSVGANVNVYNYSPFAVLDEQVIALLQDNNSRLHFYTVTLARTRAHWHQMSDAQAARYRVWTVTGFLATDDSASPHTQTVFEAEIEAIITAIEADLELGGAVEPFDDARHSEFNPIGLPDARFDYRDVLGMLVHHVEMSITTRDVTPDTIAE